MKLLPSQQELNERFSYNEETGVLTFKNHNYKSYEGKVVGYKQANGYVVVNYKGKKYRAHRVIWMMMTGEDPKELTIDHIDGDKSNNTWSNLRIATDSQQQHNKRYRGYRKTPWGYTVRILINGERVTLGTFKTEHEAQSAYQVKCKEVRGDFAPCL